MNVSDRVKNIYKSTSVTKHLVIVFPELNHTVFGSDIYADSLKLSEKLADTDSIEFVGCIASKFEVQIRDFGTDIKGKEIYAYIYTDGTEQEPISLFHGIVDEAKLQSNHKVKNIVAYDYLYTKGNIDVAEWYNNLSFPITLGDLRRSLFREIDLIYENKQLPNDNITIEKQYEPQTLQSIVVIKSICQINGVFGIINRNGNFEFRALPEIDTGNPSLPSLTLYPPFYPSGGDYGTDQIPSYKKVDYQEYSVKPVDMIQIRQSEDDEGVTYDPSGEGVNKYIIQGNMFTYKLDPSDIQTVARNMYQNVANIEFIPYDAENSGFPWIECGSSILDYYVYDFENSTSENDVYKRIQFYVLNRGLTGIQNLRDSYNAKGDEYQREFITDINARLSTINVEVQEQTQNIIEQYTYDKDTIDDMFAQIPTGFDVQSVAALPANPDMNTIYLIQGEVVVN